MGSGLLRVLDIPDKVEGHGGVNLKEEVLKIADGLFKQRETENIPFSFRINHAIIRLSPNIYRVNPKYYNQMIQVYENILMMVNEITECRDSSQIDELMKDIKLYREQSKERLLQINKTEHKNKK
ncbi:MAG: hypothetical protein NTU63_03875 [Candidatus Pacearchaeota archaeon]|nr:hypothetical protein [Candidatus Pacearchaeota archaeon]